MGNRLRYVCVPVTNRTRVQFLAYFCLLNFVVFVHRDGWKARSALISLGTEVTALAACKIDDQTRVDLFRKAFQSWASVPEISEIIVVDWGSSTSIHEILSKYTFGTRSSTSISVIRVDNAQTWRLGAAINVGIFRAQKDIVLKLDCDTYLAHNFLNVNNLYGVGFRFADGRVSLDANGKHLNGVFLARKKHLIDIHAFDERFELYGYDDSDLYNRLTAHISSLGQYTSASSSLQRMQNGSVLITHLEHERTRVHIGEKRFEQFGNCFNKKSLSHVGAWTVQSRHSFEVIRTKLIKMENFDVNLSVQRILSRPESLQRLLPRAICLQQSFECAGMGQANESDVYAIDSLVCGRT